MIKIITFKVNEKENNPMLFKASLVLASVATGLKIGAGAGAGAGLHQLAEPTIDVDSIVDQESLDAAMRDYIGQLSEDDINNMIMELLGIAYEEGIVIDEVELTAAMTEVMLMDQSGMSQEEIDQLMTDAMVETVMMLIEDVSASVDTCDLYETLTGVEIPCSVIQQQ